MSRRLVPLVCFAVGLAVILSGDMPTVTGQDKKPLVVPVAPQAPTLTTPANLGAKPGAAVELTLTGTNLTDPTSVLLGGGATGTIVEDKKPDATKVKAKIDVPAKTPIGLYTIRVSTKHGVSNIRPFVVDDLPEVAELETNRTKDAAQPVTSPCVVTGKTDTEASDFFKVKVSGGQRLTFEVLARRIGSPLDPIIVLHDAKTKRELVDLYADDTPGLQGDCRLTHTFKEPGEFLVEVRDTTYRGGADYFYRLRVGDFPGVTTAFPLAIERGKSAKIGFAGPTAADVPPVDVKVPEGALGSVYATPKRAGGASGWPVPVRISDNTEATEVEPNNEAAKGNKLPVPGGVSAKFDKAGDIDCFTVAAKKGQKYVASALAFEVNAPTEVLIKVLDAKGAEVARSNPTQPAARAEFTPAADGDYTIACEHTNYLHGPNEVYHLTVAPASPDFALTLALDRFEAMPGGGTAVAVATITRANGFAGPIFIESSGTNLSGNVTVPAGATSAFVPLSIRGGAHTRAEAMRVRGTAKIDGKDVVRYATMTDIVKTALGGMPNPPQELLTEAAVAVIEKPPFEIKLTAESATVEKGKAGKVLVEVVRGAGADGDITLTALQTPANVTAALKPIPKGQTKADIALTVAPAAAVGPSPLVFRATTKVGGKDYTITPPPVAFEVVEAKKVEPKKDEPKKTEPKKEEPKKVEVKKDEPKKKDEVKKVEPKKDEPKKKNEPKKKDGA